jgi:hypothetical protein
MDDPFGESDMMIERDRNAPEAAAPRTADGAEDLVALETGVVVEGHRVEELLALPVNSGPPAQERLDLGHVRVVSVRGHALRRKTELRIRA